MNKHELIKKYETKGEQLKELPVVAIGDVLKNLRELDELEKVQIPQFVASWIEYCKRHNFTLFGCLDPVDGFERLVDENFEGDARKCIRWCKSASDKLARAWLDGYEVGVEEEKKYKIKLLNRNDGDLYLVNQNADLANQYGHFSPVVLLFTKCTNFSKKCYELTKKEVVSYDFGWVFDCPGIKIEEVDD